MVLVLSSNQWSVQLESAGPDSRFGSPELAYIIERRKTGDDLAEDGILVIPGWDRLIGWKRTQIWLLFDKRFGFARDI